MHQVESQPAPPTEVVPLTPPKAVVRKRRIAWLLTILCSIPSILLYVFGAPLTASFLLTAPLLVLLGGRLRGCALLGVVTIASLSLTKVPLVEYTKRVQALENQRRAGGPSAFSQRDLASIW